MVGRGGMGRFGRFGSGRWDGHNCEKRRCEIGFASLGEAFGCPEVHPNIGLDEPDVLMCLWAPSDLAQGGKTNFQNPNPGPGTPISIRHANP